jgi:hypothetical protein
MRLVCPTNVAKTASIGHRTNEIIMKNMEIAILPKDA